MPVGPITPGSYITITPDALVSLPASFTLTPSPTMAVLSANMQAITLAMVSADNLLGQLDYTFAGVKTFSDNVHIAQTKALVADGTGIELHGTFSGDSGSYTTLTGSWVGDSSFSAQLGGVVALTGRKVLYRTRVAIADADKTVAVASGAGIDYAGDRFTLPGNGAGTAVKRTITVKNTSPAVPFEGERITFICNNATNTVNASGVAYEFVRTDASTIAVVYWQFSDVDAAHGVGGFWLTLEYISGVWQLAENSGILAQDAGGGNWKYVGVQRV
jgi:hypothetical protein